MFLGETRALDGKSAAFPVGLSDEGVNTSGIATTHGISASTGAGYIATPSDDAAHPGSQAVWTAPVCSVV